MKQLTSGEKNVYLALLILGSATQKQLADFLGIKRSHISQYIRQLDVKGYIKSENRLIIPICDVTSQVTNVTPQVTQMLNVTSRVTNVTSQVTPSKKEAPLSPPLPSSLRLSSSNPPIIPPEKNILITNGHLSQMTESLTQDELIPSSSSSKKKTPQTKKASQEALAHFDAFWNRYPRKIKKSYAKAKYLKALEDGVDPKVILDGLNRARIEWAADGRPEFIPHPSSWINQKRWEDDYIIDPTLEAEAPPPAPPKPKAEPIPLFDENEEMFLKEFGKRPRTADEVSAFHRA